MRCRLPGQRPHPAVHRAHRGTRFPRRVRRHHVDQPAARGVRTRVSSGKPVRGRVHGRRIARTRGHRSPRALGRRPRHQRGLVQRALHRGQCVSRRHRRVGTRGHGLCCRHGEGRLRRHRVRGVSRAGRRPQVRHPGFPVAQYRSRRRDRQARGTRHQVRVQHAGRSPVQHRTDGRRDGFSLGVRRHGRRLPELHGHPRRIAQRRALGQ